MKTCCIRSAISAPGQTEKITEFTAEAVTADTGTLGGVVYLTLSMVISIWSNFSLQNDLYPLVPKPISISLCLSTFGAVYILPAMRAGINIDEVRVLLPKVTILRLTSLVGNSLFNASLLLTSVSAVTVISSTSVFFTLILSTILLGTDIRAPTIVSIILSLTGSVLVVTS